MKAEERSGQPRPRDEKQPIDREEENKPKSLDGDLSDANTDTEIKINEDGSSEDVSKTETPEEPTMASTPEATTEGSKIALPEVVTSSENEQDSATESDDGNSDQEVETTTTTTTGSTTDANRSPRGPAQAPQERAEDEEALSDVRRLIARGLCRLTPRERNRIDEEVHGVRHLGMPHEGPEPRVRQVLFLEQFQEVLDAAVSSRSEPTAAYELCLRKNYAYATTSGSEELRLMCLRAELWDPEKACGRFLHHLTALLKYYGEEALQAPLTIDQLDREDESGTKIAGGGKDGQAAASKDGGSGRKQAKKRKSSENSRGIYKKGKGGSKRKGSLDSLPDMLALKSGFIQVLPSRDRSGRRVVVLQPVPSKATDQQSRRQAHFSKFKAMIYFLTAFLRRDPEAQQKGFVLILNSTAAAAAEDRHEEEAADEVLPLRQYRELCRFIPVRICALHFAYDGSSVKSETHRICRTILDSFLESDPKTSVARVHLYDRDVSNDSTKHLISPFGIPTHQIPLTHTGTIKLKEHNGWVKIQEWYDKKSKQRLLQPHLHLQQQQQSKFNVIECPGTNDVLFSQGGKYWNGVNRFQRGNLEFMEFLESKIDLYQSTLSWKKKHTILAAVVAEFAQTPQNTGKNARFLETATQIEGVIAPDGCWVELPLTSPLLMQKIRQTLLNHIRRLESSGKRKPAPTKAVRAKKESKSTKKEKAKQRVPTTTTTTEVVGDNRTTTSATKPETAKQQQPQKAKKKALDDAKDRGGSPSKKRKIASSSSSSSLPIQSVMKNNKLAMATFGSNLNDHLYSLGDGAPVDHEASLLHKQAICEFLANAERIAVSTAAVDLACENYNDDGDDADLDDGDANANPGNNLQDAIANDEKLVQAIIANDDRLNKEVGELFEMDSFLRDEDEDVSSAVSGVERDEIADCLMGCML